MVFRVTDRMLENLVERLNEISKCRYRLGHSYGMVHLEKKSMECTGISVISQGNTKKELYYQLQTLFEWLHTEQNSKQDYVKNCTHLDVFNIHTSEFDNGEKHDVSHIREYGGKFKCITCGKDDFSKKDYEESHKPRSREELRSLRVDRQ